MTSEWDPGMGGEGAAPSAESGLVPAVARRKGIVLMVLVFGLGLAYLYFLEADRVYQSSAQILIVKQEKEFPLEGLQGATNYENTISTHMLLAKSADIVERAVIESHLAELPGFVSVANPAEVIAVNLTTERAGGRAAPDPNVFDIRYRGPNPAECQQILQAVIDSYRTWIGATYQNEGIEDLKLIEQAQIDIETTLEKVQGEYQQFRENSEFVPRSEDGRNLHLVRMSEIEQDRGEVVRERSKILAQIEAVQQIKESGGNPEALMLVIGDSKVLRPLDDGRDPLQHQLWQAMIEKGKLLNQYGADHPKVIETETEIEILHEQLGGKAMDRQGRPKSFLDLYLEALQQEIQVADKKIEKLNELFDKEQTAAKDLDKQEQQNAAWQARITRNQDLFDQVMKRLDEASLIQDFGNLKAEVISPPKTGTQVQPNLLVVMSIAVVFSLLVGIVLAYVVDLADTRFRDPEEIRREFGLSILGHVPILGRHATRRQRKQSQLSPMVCTFFQPSGRDAEAYRNIRTSILFNRQGKNLKVFQVTSPSSGDGKSTLSANLAVSLAQSGKQVLLLDADMRRPCAHALLGVPNQLGLSALLDDKCEITDAILSTEIPNLSIITAGPSPTNPAELLVSTRFSDLVQVVREKFDFVIVDSPPVLPVSDPATISPIVDATLLVLRLNKQVRRNASEALDILIDVGGNVMGLVINGVEKKSYNTRYYEYGDRYSDRYGYYYGGPKQAATPQAVPQSPPLIAHRKPSPKDSESRAI